MKYNKFNVFGIVFFYFIFIGFASAQTVTINCGVEYQKIRGFGGINMPGWINDLTTDQTNLAFGNAYGQMGLSILRVRVPYDATQFYKEVNTAALAKKLGAIIFASPWSPPPAMKSINNIVGGTLNPSSYSDYAAHLLSFVNYMNNNGAPLYAVSLQNEPDIAVTYESCSWTAQQMIDFLKTQGSKFDLVKVIAAESYHFDKNQTDPILNDPDAEKQMDIVGGHIYGGGLADYPLARQKNKEVWMTEHYTDSKNPANLWPLALDVGSEIHNCMVANYNAYVWWYIRRSYGLIDESGLVTKRGYLMAQYSKFVRPGFVRVSATPTPVTKLNVTAYKSDTSMVVVVVNKNTTATTLNFSIQGAEITSLKKFTTSELKNVYNEGIVPFSGSSFGSTVDAQSVTTFVSKLGTKTGVGGIPDESQPKIRIYPNPVIDEMTLSVNERIECSSKGGIYNRLGMLIMEFNFDNQKIKLDVSRLPKDVYMIRIAIKNEIYYQKFIKN